MANPSKNKGIIRHSDTIKNLKDINSIIIAMLLQQPIGEEKILIKGITISNRICYLYTDNNIGPHQDAEYIKSVRVRDPFLVSNKSSIVQVNDSKLILESLPRLKVLGAIEPRENRDTNAKEIEYSDNRYYSYNAITEVEGNSDNKEKYDDDSKIIIITNHTRYIDETSDACLRDKRELADKVALARLNSPMSMMVHLMIKHQCDVGYIRKLRSSSTFYLEKNGIMEYITSKDIIASYKEDILMDHYNKFDTETAQRIKSILSEPNKQLSFETLGYPLKTSYSGIEYDTTKTLQDMYTDEIFISSGMYNDFTTRVQIIQPKLTKLANTIPKTLNKKGIAIVTKGTIPYLLTAEDIGTIGFKTVLDINPKGNLATPLEILYKRLSQKELEYTDTLEAIINRSNFDIIVDTDRKLSASQLKMLSEKSLVLIELDTNDKDEVVSYLNNPELKDLVHSVIYKKDIKIENMSEDWVKIMSKDISKYAASAKSINILDDIENNHDIKEQLKQTLTFSEYKNIISISSQYYPNNLNRYSETRYIDKTKSNKDIAKINDLHIRPINILEVLNKPLLKGKEETVFFDIEYYKRIVEQDGTKKTDKLSQIFKLKAVVNNSEVVYSIEPVIEWGIDAIRATLTSDQTASLLIKEDGYRKMKVFDDSQIPLLATDVLVSIPKNELTRTIVIDTEYRLPVRQTRAIRGKEECNYKALVMTKPYAIIILDKLSPEDKEILDKYTNEINIYLREDVVK